MPKFMFPTLIVTTFAWVNALAEDLPVRLISAQVEVLSKEAQEYFPDDIPVILIGESDTSRFVVGDVVKSYDFALYNVAEKVDTAQSHSGFSYLINNKTTKERPSGKYQFIIKYWLPKEANFPVALYFEGKPISNPVKIQGKYQGSQP